MSAPVLVARGVVKAFRDGEVETTVLKGVDLTVGAGEFVALTGPSGSGKSTLLSILGTLLSPTAGRVEVAGRRIDRLGERELTRFRNRHIGFVFQFHHLLGEFTALENVLFPAYARDGRETREARQRALGLLERVGLGERTGYRASRLSGGQKQRVAVARAVMTEPGVVLADEPTGNLDRETSGEVMELLGELSLTSGTAFLISTHDPDIAARCDRVIHLVDGRVEGARGAGPDLP